MMARKNSPDFYTGAHGPTPNYVTDEDIASARVIVDGLLAEPMERDEMIVHLATWRRLAIEVYQARREGKCTLQK